MLYEVITAFAACAAPAGTPRRATVRLEPVGRFDFVGGDARDPGLVAEDGYMFRESVQGNVSTLKVAIIAAGAIFVLFGVSLAYFLIRRNNFV